LRNDIRLKNLLTLLISVCLLPIAYCQEGSYWQQRVNYSIDVSLNDQEHSLNGFESIEYFNNSPDTLRFIWFHVWPNAFKNDRTAFSDQELEHGSTQFYFSDREDRGYINRLDFKVDGVTADMEDHPQYIDIIKVVLPTPLAPGNSVHIETPFHVKIPRNFSRGGHSGQSYQITQWYPKPAVYDKKGWHPIPYLDQGEFYSEFGKFSVNITVPENYVVAATGQLQDEKEKTWLKERASFTWEPIRTRVKTKSGQVQTIEQLYPESSSSKKTLHYVQDSIHDFAWFADKRFIVKSDTCLLPSGKVVEAFSYYTPAQAGSWDQSLQTIKDAVRTRSLWVGEYPYNVVSAVQGPSGFGGGMEYPTITIISPGLNANLLDFTIAHEVSHNWFYGILGTNERTYPWMDEGINTYYDNRYARWKWGPEGEIRIGKHNFSIKQAERLLFESKTAVKKDQPINTPGDQFTDMNYDLIAYYKTGAWLELIESRIGKEQMDKAMQEYYREWKFKHPYPEDFRKVLESVSGQDLSQEFSLLDKKGILPGMERKGWHVVSPLSPGTFFSYIKNPSKDWLLVTPVLGASSYDGFMIGGLFTNYKLPASRFQFLAVPVYAMGSKRLTGMGKLNYSFYPDKALFRKVDLFVNGSLFSMDEFTTDQGKKVKADYYKIVPGLKLTLSEKKPGSTRERYIQWKSFLFREEYFRISYDSVFSGMDTTVIQQAVVRSGHRTLQQLKIVIDGYRALYPYKAELNIEQGKDFIRAAFTGNYFFNYPKEGGLNLRLFAGKFFYTGAKTISKQFATDRYHLNMTGANGYEDYTYSDYFIGRNRFDKLPSQQIMVRDGAFKVRTDLYADKVGKTDSWLAAINLTTTIPKSVNPLSLFPVKIPVRLFADIGTYGDAWKKDANLDRFIFDAGLQLSFFAETVNIYIPLLYSTIFRDYNETVL